MLLVHEPVIKKLDKSDKMVWILILTRDMYALPGTPLSLAKDHNKREAVAMIPTAAARRINKIINVMPVAAALLLVAPLNISTNGKPVAELRASSIFPRQKRRAISNAKPRTPFKTILLIIAQGMTVEAL